ncbi:MAG: hypothetical protein KAH97_00145 [Anaerolineales bacterium]|nr:hypothetical protein [Anaerolineales bacterium]
MKRYSSAKVKCIKIERLKFKKPSINLLIHLAFTVSILVGACSTSTPSPNPASPTEPETASVQLPTAIPTLDVPPLTSAPPTPSPQLFPPVTSEEWSRGPDDAEITILIYSDFQ